MFTSLECILDILKENYPNPARSSNAVHTVKEAFNIYKKKCLAKQTTITSFFKSGANTSISNSSTPGTSTGISTLTQACFTSAPADPSISTSSTSSTPAGPKASPAPSTSDDK
ncbi:hypothetical protein Pcinc_009281 [Petrolisthes cinctipes]|uniref:Uncharacterized protein n=1 Tax=Petrolisthes cinctipes TaxID=88211 RepID=A0AAE1G530_PETCI|nr:hypothetical protein Pcinc_009251 [Petrolisthes cinctipes]KAK3886634.1 hypothetical protein Pcinc_009281 [Petrolisthes cinctipes]